MKNISILEKGDENVLEIIEQFRDHHESVYLEQNKVDSIVENVLRTIKDELPEEAQTVEVFNYITDEVKEKLKGKRIVL